MFTSKKKQSKAWVQKAFWTLKTVVPVLAVEKFQVSTPATPFCTDTRVYNSLARWLQTSVGSRTEAGVIFHGAQLLSAVFLFNGQVFPGKPTACPAKSWVNNNFVCQRVCLVGLDRRCGEEKIFKD